MKKKLSLATLALVLVSCGQSDESSSKSATNHSSKTQKFYLKESGDYYNICSEVDVKGNTKITGANWKKGHCSASGLKFNYKCTSKTRIKKDTVSRSIYIDVFGEEKELDKRIIAQDICREVNAGTAKKL